MIVCCHCCFTGCEVVGVQKDSQAERLGVVIGHQLIAVAGYKAPKDWEACDPGPWCQGQDMSSLRCPNC